MNQLVGHDPGDIEETGLNTVTSPSSDRQLIFDHAGTSHTGESSLTSSDTFQLHTIDWMLEIAKTATPVVRPLKIGGKEYYVMFMHPYNDRGYAAKAA